MTVPVLSVGLEGEYFFQNVTSVFRWSRVSAATSFLTSRTAGWAVLHDRDIPKTALCPTLSLLLTQEEVNQDFFSNLGHR